MRHATEHIQRVHLRELMRDERRVQALRTEYDGVYLDFSRQRVTEETMRLLYALAERARLRDKIDALRAGKHVNSSENRAVLHTALRAARSDSLVVDGHDVRTGAPRRTPWRDRQATEECDRGGYRRLVSGAGFCARGAAHRPGGQRDRPRPPSVLFEQCGSGGCQTLHAGHLGGGDVGGGGQQVVHHLRDAAECAHHAGVVVARAGHCARSGAPAHGGVQQQSGHGGQLRHRSAECVRALGLGRRPLLGVLGGGRAAALHPVRFRGVRVVFGGRALDGRQLLRHLAAAVGEPAGGDGAAGRVEHVVSGVSGACGAPVRRGAAQVSGAHSASGYGEQRQARDAARRCGRLCGGRDRFRRAGHQWAALVFSVAAHGPGGAVRLYRLHRVAESSVSGGRAGEQRRRADGQLLRPAGCTGVRQDRRGVPRRRPSRGAHSASGDHRQPPQSVAAAAAPEPVHHRPAVGAVRAPHRGAGLHLGHQLVRPVGRGAGQDARQTGAPAAESESLLWRGGVRPLQRVHPRAAGALPARAGGLRVQRPVRLSA
eukprot:ctg_2391.g444